MDRARTRRSWPVPADRSDVPGGVITRTVSPRRTATPLRDPTTSSPRRSTAGHHMPGHRRRPPFPDSYAPLTRTCAPIERQTTRTGHATGIAAEQRAAILGGTPAFIQDANA